MIRLLAIDTGTEPITVEKVELNGENQGNLSATIVNLLNKHGKNSHCLLGTDVGDLWLYSHTAKRGPSDAYFKEKIVYHPMAAEILS